MKQHYHKAVNHVRARKRSYTLGLFIFVLLINSALGFFIFTTTKGALPNTSELAFTEYSETHEGSIIPASCNSSPATSHFMNDCVTTCWNGTVYDPYLNAGACPTQVPGCTDPSAANYNSSANSPNGTCVYNCTGTAWGTVANGDSVTAYQSSSPAGSCISETRTCTNGSLSGSYTNPSCSNGCTGTPWGNVASGYSNTAYQSGSPSASCASVSETRTCTNGTMSGSYTTTSCTSGCTGTPWGDVANGYSNTAYLSSSPAGSCSSQARTCTNGTLSGSYSATSCTPGCTGATQTWGSCSGTVSATSHGATSNANDVATPYTGNATYLCTSGSWSVQGGTTCTPPASVGSFTNNGPITYNTSANLTYTSSNASSCTIDNGVVTGGSVSSTKSTPALTSSVTYTLTCTSAGGNATAQTTVLIIPTGTLTSPVTSCTIATGSGSCSISFTWTTTNPMPGFTSQVVADGGVGPDSTAANNSTQSLSIPYGGKTLRLYNAGYELASRSVTSTCAIGGFDTVSGTCRDPRVNSVVVTNQYYSTPGNIAFSCTGSNNWEMLRNGTAFDSGTYSGGTVNVSVLTTGNYSIFCKYGDYASPAYVALYNAPPPPTAKITLAASPRTIVKNGTVALSWSTQFPTTSCTTTAKVVCTNNVCTADQLAWQTTVNTILATENVDTGSVGGIRSVKTAITTVAPGHENTDWKALGKKTITKIPYTTDFTYRCSASNQETKRVQVARSKEN